MTVTLTPDRSRRTQVFLLLTALYFAQGLPFGFFVQALPVVLRQRGYSLEAVGLTALLALPWALKFVWAPLVDRWASQRTWILGAQLGMTLLLVGLSMLSAGQLSIPLLMVGVFGTNLLAATQDIATDGLAVQLLPEEDRGIANGVQVAAYRLGMIVGGGALLALFDLLNWTGAFLVMAVLVVITSLPVLGLSAARTRRAHAPDAAASVLGFVRRDGALKLIFALTLYKAGEAAASAMLRPMLVDYGLTLADIGWMLGTVGFVAGLLGALVGGWAAGRGDRRPVLVLFAVLQAGAAASYALISPDTTHGLMALVVAAEHFVSGLATAALFTTMMDRCQPETASTDYTVQASAVVISTGTASALAGYSASGLGYTGHFLASALLSLGAIAVVPWLFMATRERA